MPKKGAPCETNPASLDKTIENVISESQTFDHSVTKDSSLTKLVRKVNTNLLVIASDHPNNLT